MGQATCGRAGPYFARIRRMKIPEKDKSRGKLPKYLANFARKLQNLKFQGGAAAPLSRTPMSRGKGSVWM